MKNKIYESMDAAVADIPDGATILSPGFGGVGVPRNLLAALNRQGAKDLTGVSNNAGTVDENIDIGTLVEARQMKKMICAFVLHPDFSGYRVGRRQGAPRDQRPDACPGAPIARRLWPDPRLESR